jgi:hypothetical protein
MCSPSWFTESYQNFRGEIFHCRLRDLIDRFALVNTTCNDILPYGVASLLQVPFNLLINWPGVLSKTLLDSDGPASAGYVAAILYFVLVFNDGIVVPHES